MLLGYLHPLVDHRELKDRYDDNIRLSQKEEEGKEGEGKERERKSGGGERTILEHRQVRSMVGLTTTWKLK